MCERIDAHDASEIWLYGIDDEHPDRCCSNCGNPIDTDRLQEPDDESGLLLCPECGAELPWSRVSDVPTNDWFNWACLEKEDYPARPCFDEPEQRSLSLAVSLADPRGADVGLEVTRTTAGDILVKVENRESFTYYTHVATTTEGSYTVVRFRRRH